MRKGRRESDTTTSPPSQHEMLKDKNEGKVPTGTAGEEIKSQFGCLAVIRWDGLKREKARAGAFRSRALAVKEQQAGLQKSGNGVFSVPLLDR